MLLLYLSQLRFCLFSSVVERYPCKVVVASSILAGGFLLYMINIYHINIHNYIFRLAQNKFLFIDAGNP